ncbi:MAG: (d)CMP kinase [Synergistaceae bacterium]|nr:(d)CMP kinase [Synergistaceae bacterium]MBQ9574995.1 (d)CMP kinase [Synergistaceae bacterium]
MSYVITIDGPAGAGKSSVAKDIAARLGIKYLDTGAIYRAIALILHESEVEPVDDDIMREALEKITILLEDKAVLVNGFDVTGEIRTPEVDALASIYSAVPSVRKALLGLQKEQEKHGSIVAEGRDVGSVVFPNARAKFFLTASPEARAERRYRERIAKGKEADYDTILKSIIERDKNDSNRDVAPLTVPENAVYVDTSDMTEDEAVDFILAKIKEVLPDETE